MYTNLNDNLIKTVVNTAFPDYSGRKIQVKYNTKEFNLNSYWQDGSKNFYVIIELSSLKILPLPENGNIFNKLNVNKFTLPVGFLVIEHCIFCGKDFGITIYCSENPTLPEPKNNDLTELDLNVLAVTRGYKSSYANISDYRMYELINHYHYKKLDIQESRIKLQSMGYLDRRMAITINGKNLVINR